MANAELVEDDIFNDGIVVEDSSSHMDSATIGLRNYGAFYDLVQSGISRPVEIAGRKGVERVIKLSSHKWSYTGGMHGLHGHPWCATFKHKRPFPADCCSEGEMKPHPHPGRSNRLRAIAASLATLKAQEAWLRYQI